METIKLDLIPGKKMPSLHASQYDKGRDYHIDLTENRVPYTLDGTETISLTVRKCDNTLVTMDIANTFADKSYIEFRTTEQMNACAGFNYGEITIEKNGTQISSLNFYLQVEGAPDEGGITSQSEINNLNRQITDEVDRILPDMVDEIAEPIVRELVPEVVGDNYYDKGETNDKFATKKALEEVSGDIPTKTSELTNDSNFAEIDDTSTSSDKAWSASKASGVVSGTIRVKGNPLIFEDSEVHTAEITAENATLVAVYGKQLFNADRWSGKTGVSGVSNGVITFNGQNTTSSSNNVIRVPMLPPATYTVKVEAMDENTKYCRVIFRNDAGGSVADIGNYRALPFTATLSPFDIVRKMSIIAKHETSDSVNIGAVRVTINRGMSVGDYAPYIGNEYSNLPEPIQTVIGENFIVCNSDSEMTLNYYSTINSAYLLERVNKNAEDIDVINKSDIIKFNQDVRGDVDACSSYGIQNAHTLSMLIATDVHSTSCIEIVNMVKYLNAMDSIDIGLCLGDEANAYYTDSSAGWVNAVKGSNKPFYNILGNHDLGNGKSLTNATTVENAFKKWVKETTSIEGLTTPYYKVDFAEHKTTLIFLNNYDVPDTIEDGQYKVSRAAEVVSQTQIDWLLGVLDSVPSDYTIIIFRHSFPDANTWYDCNFSMYSRTMYGATVGCYTDIIPDIVNAWKNGTALSKTYAPQISDVTESVTINHDFSSRGKGKFACYVVGHIHKDVVAKSTTYPEQIAIGFEATCYAEWINNNGDLPRVENEKSQDALTVLSLDTDHKLIRLVRVGSNKSVRMVDRTSIALSYT